MVYICVSHSQYAVQCLRQILLDKKRTQTLKTIHFKPFFSLIMFYLNMVDYPMFFLLLSTWTLRGTQCWYLNHVLPLKPSTSYRAVGGCGWCWPIRF